MNISSILQTKYNDFCVTREYQFNEKIKDNTTEKEKKLIFFVDEILNLTTYCDDYSLRIGEKLLDIIKYMYKEHNNDTDINTDYNIDNQFIYCLLVQYINNWLNWGTNIYSAWITNVIIDDIEFTNKKDIEYFINFIDNKI